MLFAAPFVFLRYIVFFVRARDWLFFDIAALNLLLRRRHHLLWRGLLCKMQRLFLRDQLLLSQL
jgi:hypothetical protein